MISELHFEVAGPEGAPVLVLAPSLGTTAAMWDAATPALAADHRIVRFEHRGHGRSPLPPERPQIADLGGDVLALLDRLGLERVDYAGVSLGGMVGMWLAAHAPQRIGRLVAICTSAHLPPAEAWAERAAAVRAAGSVGVVTEAVLARWFTPAYAAAHPDVIASTAAMLRACPPEGYAACCEAIEQMDLRADLPAVTAPTLVIAAAEDPSTPPAHAEVIAAAVPGARLEVLARGAHLAVIERSGEVTALIREHLEAA